MTSDPSQRRLRDWIGDLTVPQAWGVAGGIIVILGTTLSIGYWVGLHDQSSNSPTECSYSNLRINARTWPAPGQAFGVDTSPVNVEWDSKGCSATVQTYYAGALAWSAQVHSPAAVELNRGPGEYELKLWEQMQGRPPLAIAIVKWAPENTPR